MDQAADFLAETEALAGLLAPLPDGTFAEATQFKGWTVNDVIRHLHFWNRAAGLQLTDEAELVRLLSAIAGAGGMRAVELSTVPESGQALRAAWLKTAGEIADIYATADPRARLKWAGPDMSARSSITARLLETWAHGQDIADSLKWARISTERLKHIAHIGVRAMPFAFASNKLPAPDGSVFVSLTGPNGDTWTWGDESAESSVSGPALGFCLAVTQRRHIDDCGLTTVGEPASTWMPIAQSFAGPPGVGRVAGQFS